MHTTVLTSCGSSIVLWSPTTRLVSARVHALAERLTQKRANACAGVQCHRRQMTELCSLRQLLQYIKHRRLQEVLDWITRRKVGADHEVVVAVPLLPVVCRANTNPLRKTRGEFSFRPSAVRESCWGSCECIQPRPSNIVLASTPERLPAVEVRNVVLTHMVIR